MSFRAAKKIETWYGVALRKIARHIGDLVRHFDPEDPRDHEVLQQMLGRYEKTLEPWARSVSTRMIEDVRRDTAKVWFSRAVEIGTQLRRELAETATGVAVRQAHAAQVDLITSLPREAAERVQRLSVEALTSGGRAKEVAAEILRTGEVTKSRANMIARTEVSRTTTLLTQARAEAVGSTGYVWRTVHDTDVRPSHKKMEGIFVPWNRPPSLDGMVGHAGCLPNCRCYADPVIPSN